MVIDSSVVIAIQYDELLKIFAPAVVAFDTQQATLARTAWRIYGKGRHPEKLNFGGCCSYATARHLKQPLLFKGNDFSQTDIEKAS